jgi:hypothetical protein
MNMKIVLSVLLLFGGVLIITPGIDSVKGSGPEFIRQAQAKAYPNEGLANDKVFDMPGAGNCEACHSQPDTFSDIPTSHSSIYEQLISRR